MKPGQLVLNELETAILEALAIEDPSIAMKIINLHVLSREYTGVGSFTKFLQKSNINLVVGNKQIGLSSQIILPTVKNGLGAMLFCENENLICLEIFAYGEECWDGVYSGFTIRKNA